MSVRPAARRSGRHAALVGAVLAALAATSGAQEPGGATLRGVAYDSLGAKPLAGALVSITALGRTAISDSGGVFAFDSVPAGQHELVLQHEMLDALGLPEPRRVVEVPMRERVVIATPSFAALWRSTCGGTAPRDSGFVFGAIRSARDRASVAGAEVRASWVDVAFDRKRGATQARMGGRVESGRDGRYAVCGVPNGVQLQMQAGATATASDAIELFHEAPGVTRRDFLLPDADATLRGVVRGVVRGSAGGPVPNALVNAPGASEVRADGDGRFMISGVALGTRVLVVRSIGAEPMTAIADVAWRDTTEIEVLLKNIATLDSVEVIGSRVMRQFVNQLAERQALGIAKFADSTDVIRLGSVVSAVLSKSNARVDRYGELLLGRSRGLQPGCKPYLWIDRRLVRQEDNAIELRLINPSEIGAIEVYDRQTMIPPEYYPQKGLPDCVLVIWTKRNFP